MRKEKVNMNELIEKMKREIEEMKNDRTRLQGNLAD